VGHYSSIQGESTLNKSDKGGLQCGIK